MNNYYGTLRDGEVSTGTTIVAIAFDGGVVMAADSRTSTGTYVANRVTNKLTQVHDRIFCCRSGSAADTQNIADVVSVTMTQHAVELGRLPQVKTAATMFRKYCYEYKDQISAGIICAGYDEVNGGSVYSIPLGGAMVQQPYAIGGSGSVFLYGLLDELYRPDMTRDEALVLAKKAIAHAIQRDGSSGGVIRTVTITADGFERDFTPGNKLPFTQMDIYS